MRNVMSRPQVRVLVLVSLAALLGAYVVFGLDQYLRLEHVKEQRAALEAVWETNPGGLAAGFFGIYVLVAALSIPGAAVLTLAAGAIFGLGWGTLIVSFSSSIGATLAFLASRFLFRDLVKQRMGRNLEVIDAGLRRDGALYLFAMRLVPAFPFVLINLLMGLTTMRTWTFYWVSQVGMLAGTLIYVNAGAQLARIDSLWGVLSPATAGSLVLLGMFPILVRHGYEFSRNSRAYAGWPRPRSFDRNLVVIGAGSAGLVTSYIASAMKAKVTLVEQHRMGGDCLNTGCVPSKALIRTARLIAQARRGRELGLRSVTVEMEFSEVMERVRGVIASTAPHDSRTRYESLGVECLQGTARIESPWEVSIAAADGSSRHLTTRAIVVATGARPSIPPIPGLDKVECLTSDTVWGLQALPRRLLVLGGGATGCELAQCFARLGSEVTVVESLPRLLAREDTAASELVEKRFAQERIRVLTGHEAIRFTAEHGERQLHCQRIGGATDVGTRVGFDAVLCAVGRRPYTDGLGLQELGIPLTRSGALEVNEFMQTRLPNILACGDVTGSYQLTNAAAQAAWYAAVNGLFGSLYRSRADFSVIPWAIFTDPEVARVGLTEQEARTRNVAFECTVFLLEELDRAIADGARDGFVKVLTAPGSDRVLGATIVGEHAGDLIIEFVTAMKNGIGLNRILQTIHVYPTWSEANKFAAGAWRRAHAPVRALRWLERFHAWRLGGATGHDNNSHV
jgi:pyruvate/2-oxoglutarate dehydrogenase complex dihydrolipoamide dehydrogenase (E3) component/uncharacterized membrane protein YdjX (TVP38/TMEM64 family)